MAQKFFLNCTRKNSVEFCGHFYFHRFISDSLTRSGMATPDEGVETEMLNQRLIRKLNLAAQNPNAHQVIIYNQKKHEGLYFDRRTNSLTCLCGFCLGDDLILTNSHINITPYGLIQFQDFLKGLNGTGGTHEEAHGADNDEFSPTNSVNNSSV